MKVNKRIGLNKDFNILKKCINLQGRQLHNEDKRTSSVNIL